MAKLYALLVGINEYHPETTVKNLKGCVNDVNAMDAFLKTSYKHLKPDIEKVVNEKATRENLIQTFQSHLGKAGAGDFVFFYYSGHGSYENTSPEFETYDSKNQNETLVCHDSRLPKHYDLADKELGVMMARLNAGAQKILILDSCHSGSITRSADEEKEGSMSRQEPARSGSNGIYKRPLDSYLLKGDNFYRIQKAQGKVSVPFTPHILFSACSRDQKALEKNMGKNAKRHGLFTTHLLDVLKTNKCKISYNSLYTQVRVSVIKDRNEQTPRLDPLFGFNPNLGFLSDQPIDRNRHDVTWDHGLKLKLGQVHGLPTEADDIANITLKLFPKNVEPHEGLDAEILSIGLEESLLSATGVQEDITYEAEIIGLPKSMAMLVGLKGSKADKKALLALNKTIKSPYIELVDVDEGVDYLLEIEGEQLQIKHRQSGLLVQGATDTEMKWCFKQMMAVLEQVEKWVRYKDLEKRATVLNENKINIKLELEKEDGEMHVVPDQVTEVTVDTKKASNGTDWETVPFRLSMNNDSRKDVYVLLIAMSRSFNVSVYYNEWIEGKTGEIELLKNDFTLGSTLSKEIDVLKVIVSTEVLNPATFTQEALELGKILKKKRGIGDTKGIGDGGKAAKKEDWFTRTFIVTVSGNESKIGEESSTINGLTFQKNSNLKANLSFGSIRSHTRSTDPINRLPEALAGSVFEIMDFAQEGSRSVSDKCIIELNDIQGEDKLAEQPLEIELDQVMEKGEKIIPAIFDGEFILPFGEVKRTADNRPMVSIDHLPAQEDDGRRSVGRALRFVLLKTVFKTRFDLFKLRWVDYSKSKTKIRTKGLEDKVKEANNILLLVHGIIGNTKFMAEQGKFAVDDKGYDLVLTYDYENLDTDIDEIAAKMHQDLIEVKLGPNHQKQLTIVAHSMGGLVSRYMIENIRKDDGSVNKLLMFGTPNGGSRFGFAPALLEEHIPEKYKALVRDQAKKWYKFALSMALNFLPGYVKVLLDYVTKLTNLDQIESPNVLNTLAMMSPDSDFIKTLLANEKPSKTEYYAICGDISDYESEGSWFKRFVDKVQVGVGKVVYFNTPNDIAVGTEDIRNIKGLDKENNTTTLKGHHLNYFDNPPSVEKWKEWL